MSKLGPKCQKCQEFTYWVGALIGGTQVFGYPEYGLLYFEPPKKVEPAPRKSLFETFGFGGWESFPY